MFLTAFNCSWSNLLSIEEKLKKKLETGCRNAPNKSCQMFRGASQIIF
jgi:hypothetical protein